MHVLLAMTLPDGRERVFRLARPSNTVGRSHRCDLRLPLPSVAMEHCRITIRDGLAALRHLADDGETIVNSRSVESIPLKERDILEIGPVRFSVRLIEPHHDLDDEGVVEIKTFPQDAAVDRDGPISAGGAAEA